MEAELRAALEQAAADLYEAGGLVDALNFRARRPTKAHAKKLFEQAERARTALEAIPEPVRGDDAFSGRFPAEVRDAFVQTIREERRRLSGKPNATELLAEAIEHRLAPLLAAHRPVREREQWRLVAGVDYSGFEPVQISPTFASRRDLEDWREWHEPRHLDPPLDTRIVQMRKTFAPGPWQDVTDEGEGA